MILLGIACLKAIVSALPLRRCSPGNGIVEGFYDIVGHFLEGIPVEKIFINKKVKRIFIIFLVFLSFLPY